VSVQTVAPVARPVMLLLLLLLLLPLLAGAALHVCH
jgi:hypothetical protein